MSRAVPNLLLAGLCLAATSAGARAGRLDATPAPAPRTGPALTQPPLARGDAVSNEPRVRNQRRQAVSSLLIVTTVGIGAFVLLAFLVMNYFRRTLRDDGGGLLEDELFDVRTRAAVEQAKAEAAAEREAAERDGGTPDGSNGPADADAAARDVPS